MDISISSTLCATFSLMTQLLHQPYLQRMPFAVQSFSNNLLSRAQDVANAANNLKDPDISVVIRSRNKAEQLKLLFEDIDRQDFSGRVEIVLVDTDSHDETVKLGTQYGAKIVRISQKNFTYPKALNIGFEAASYNWVFTLTDHCLLSSDQVFHIATLSEQNKNIGGVSGIILPNSNASFIELLGSILILSSRVKRQAQPTKKLFMGILPANTSLVNRQAWEKVGGFNEQFAAGGEDSELAASMIKAGYTIILNPAMSAHHSHGLGLIESIQQYHYWTTLNKPQEFNLTKLSRFRKELHDTV